MLVVTIFRDPDFMYLQPSSTLSLDMDKVALVFNTVFIPMLNSIYSLRNREVKEALKNAVGSSSQAYVLVIFQKGL